MLKNPENGMTPASASEPMRNVAHVTGMCRRSPPISRMSCVLAEWMMTPAPRKSSDLKNACVTRWKSAAPTLAAPSAMNMSPSCEMVEYASTFLTSCWTAASSPPTIAVIDPMMSVAWSTAGAASKTGIMRATR